MGRYRNVSILAAAIFLQIVGLAVQVKRRSQNQSTRLIRVWTVAAITPLEKNIVRLQTGSSDIWRNYLYLRGVRQQNRELQDQIQQLQLEQVRLHQDAQQARRLQALLGFKGKERKAGCGQRRAVTPAQSIPAYWQTRRKYCCEPESEFVYGLVAPASTSASSSPISTKAPPTGSLRIWR